MELRKDPITRSWVVMGHPQRQKQRADDCPLCPGNRIETHLLLELPAQGQWQVRAYPHFRPLYHVEGDLARTAEGIYDRMAPIGAHEIIVETPEVELSRPVRLIHPRWPLYVIPRGDSRFMHGTVQLPGTHGLHRIESRK